MKNVLEEKKAITIIGNVYETYDYDMFRLIDSNRKVKERDVKKLSISIRKKYNLCPIIITPNLYVIDGQHRLLVCKELGLPVRYVVDNDATIDDISRLNSYSKKWTQHDYLLSYRKQGIKEYEIVHKFVIKHNVPIKHALMYLNDDSGSVTTSFKEGNLEIVDLDRATWMVEKFKQITKYNSKLSYRFLRVLKIMLNKKDFDIDVFIKKVELNPLKLQACATANQYKILIESIYNYKNRKKVNLRY